MYWRAAYKPERGVAYWKLSTIRALFLRVNLTSHILDVFLKLVSAMLRLRVAVSTRSNEG